MKRLPTVQVVEGRWYAMGSYDHDECCDCGLVHKMEYKFEKGRIWFRAFVDQHRTRMVRRALGITVSRENPKPHKGR